MTRQRLRTTLGIAAIAIVAAGAQFMVRAQKGTEVKFPAHVVLTSQQDRQRVMDQLKITLFPSGHGAYLASTYDETTANPYPVLPDPLSFNDGSKVKSPAGNSGTGY